ncbi:MAG: aminodeoxychorismate/anthranilate synthase component II [Bergeyella sp.]|nr:aminodeoxychorismate/anthranilate synthase component II [Bergeyella sp.]
MRILVLDNYDSFTYNLVQMIEEVSKEKTEVYRNDEISLEEVNNYDKIILSPGPGIPEEAGILLKLIKTYAHKKSIFGVCLGLQAITEAFGGELINLSEIYHGVATEARIIKEHSIFRGLGKTMEVGRYHSWAAKRKNFPEDLEITSLDPNGIIMSLKHKNFDVHGVQFHPESILTPEGKRIVANFLQPWKTDRRDEADS